MNTQNFSTPSLALVVLTALTFSVGCGQEVGHSPIPEDVTETSLNALLGNGSQTSGIAVDPESGQRFLLEPDTGIFELLDNGEVRSIWTADPTLPRLTDLCAIGGGRFVAAADGDGYIIDVAMGAARQHFCLEPGWDPGFEPGGEVKHLNRSVACDIEAGLIYGQPQTVPAEGPPTPIRSEVASYLLTTGADERWVALPDPSFRAGGMTMLRTNVLLMGAGSTLAIFDTETGVISRDLDIGAYGVDEVRALSIDRSAHTLVVVDGVDNTLVEIPLNHLALEVR